MELEAVARSFVVEPHAARGSVGRAPAASMAAEQVVPAAVVVCSALPDWGKSGRVVADGKLEQGPHVILVVILRDSTSSNSKLGRDPGLGSEVVEVLAG